MIVARAAHAVSRCENASAEGRGASRTRQAGAAASTKSREASFWTYVFATILITGALLFYVYLHVGSLRLGYELSDLRSSQLKLVQENRALKTEIGSLSGPARIRRLAREKLGMVPAEKIVDLTGGTR